MRNREGVPLGPLSRLRFHIRPVITEAFSPSAFGGWISIPNATRKPRPRNLLHRSN